MTESEYQETLRLLSNQPWLFNCQSELNRTNIEEHTELVYSYFDTETVDSVLAESALCKDESAKCKYGHWDEEFQDCTCGNMYLPDGVYTPDLQRFLPTFGDACNTTCRESCNGHGTCHMMSGVCDCEEGWDPAHKCAKEFKCESNSDCNGELAIMEVTGGYSIWGEMYSSSDVPLVENDGGKTCTTDSDCKISNLPSIKNTCDDTMLSCTCDGYWRGKGCDKFQCVIGERDQTDLVPCNDDSECQTAFVNAGGAAKDKEKAICFTSPYHSSPTKYCTCKPPYFGLHCVGSTETIFGSSSTINQDHKSVNLCFDPYADAVSRRRLTGTDESYFGTCNNNQCNCFDNWGGSAAHGHG